MALMPIVKYGDPVLRKKTLAVKDIDGKLRDILSDMFQTMYAAPGVGLAANQVGLTGRYAVIDVHPEGKKKPMVIINPVIEERSGAITEEEGCLSIPGFAAVVKRSARVKVSAIDQNGLPVVIEGEGLLARCLQHEIDHLNGKFYIDHLSLLQRMKIQREIARRKKSNLF